jgi:hypothetical protein
VTRLWSGKSGIPFLEVSRGFSHLPNFWPGNGAHPNPSSFIGEGGGRGVRLTSYLPTVPATVMFCIEKNFDMFVENTLASQKISGYNVRSHGKLE